MWLAGLGGTAIASVLLACLTLGPSVLAAPPALSPALAGWWLDGSGEAGIHLDACGIDQDKICGVIRWLLQPLTETGKPKTDQLNHDVNSRGRRICGLPMLGDFVAADDHHWSGGWIYNPDDGNLYSATMTLMDAGTLRVSGYVGISLFGKSEIWTRPGVALKPCS